MLRIILSVIAAIILLIMVISVVKPVLALVFYGLALFLIGYVIWYFLSGSKRSG